MDPKSNIKVGYGQPPVDHQFKKGQSGNPKGRPKQKKTSSEILKDLLDAEVGVDGKQSSIRELVLKGVIKDALRGKPHALKFLIPLMLTEEIQEDFDPRTDDLEVLEKYHNTRMGRGGV